MKRFFQERRLAIPFAFVLFVIALQLLLAQDVLPRVTDTEAAQAQKKLQTDPENLDARTKLLAYYWTYLPDKFVEELLWFISHHPGSQLIWMVTVPLHVASPEDITRIRVAWERALVAAPKSPDVDLNAALFFESQGDAQRALKVLWAGARLDSRDPERYMSQIAGIYATAEVQVLMPGLDPESFYFEKDPASALKLVMELEKSNDPSLLSAVGANMAYIYMDKATIHKKAFELMERAIAIDPKNAKWKQALAQAKATAK